MRRAGQATRQPANAAAQFCRIFLPFRTISPAALPMTLPAASTLTSSPLIAAPPSFFMTIDALPLRSARSSPDSIAMCYSGLHAEVLADFHADASTADQLIVRAGCQKGVLADRCLN